MTTNARHGLAPATAAVFLVALAAGPLRAAAQDGTAAATAASAAVRNPAVQNPAAQNAAPPSAAAAADDTLESSRQRIDALQARLGGAADAGSLSTLRAEAALLQARTEAVAARLLPQLDDLQERQKQLGVAPAASAASEPADVAAQRGSLDAARARIDAQIRLARLLATESQQLVERVDGLRRARFEAQLGERTASVLAPEFWAELVASWAHDRPRLARLARELGAAAGAVGGQAWLLALAAAAAALLALPYLLRLLLRIASTRLPHGRLRRSAYALGATVLPTLAVLLATQAFRQALLSGGGATPAVASLLSVVAGAFAFGTFVAALGRALASPARPTWRLLPMPDTMAEGTRRVPFVLGAAVVAGPVLERVGAIVSTALATTVAINCLYSLVLGWLLAFALGRGERLRRVALAAEGGAESVPARPLWAVALTGVCLAALAFSVGCLLVGYVSLGGFVVRQVAWILIVANAAWLLAVFVDDVWGAIFRAGDDETPAPRRQAAVLLSAASRLGIVLVAIGLLLGRLGQDPAELLYRIASLRDGFAVGEIRILPGAVLEGLAIFAVGMVVVRLLQGWLLDRYLPTTGLDAGMRSSAVTLLGYVGMVVAVALGLSAIGFGLERIAWVASALSVGIGFGLQAVVSNFVSGLILLTERPVKVGDWVSLGGVEGDIRRINVRATEIQMSDRSTLIVPNSEFITKTVRNVTHGSPFGLVQVKLPLPLDCDVERVRGLLLEALGGNGDVLESPPPAVLLDGVDGGNLVFSATGSVSSPRRVAAVKSALLADMLARLRAAGVALASPSAVLLKREPARRAAASPQLGDDAA